MNIPVGDRPTMGELEITVRTELVQAEASRENGARASELPPDPDAERYEVELRTMLGAIQAMEDDGLRPGGKAPQSGMPESARTSGDLAGQAGSVIDTDAEGW